MKRREDGEEAGDDIFKVAAAEFAFFEAAHDHGTGAARLEKNYRERGDDRANNYREELKAMQRSKSHQIVGDKPLKPDHQSNPNHHEMGPRHQKILKALCEKLKQEQDTEEKRKRQIEEDKIQNAPEKNFSKLDRHQKKELLE